MQKRVLHCNRKTTILPVRRLERDICFSKLEDCKKSWTFQLAIMIKPPYHTYPMTDVMILGTADGNVLEYMLPDRVNLVQIDYKR